MGYRGKLREQEQARTLRAQGLILDDIATQLGVAKSSVSLWVRDVPFTPKQRQYGPNRPNRLHDEKLAQIEAMNRAAIGWIGVLADDAFLAAGVALYAGEGSKRDGKIVFANSDPAMVRFFCIWLRRYFEIDESRLRARVYLHEGLDLDAAHAHWSETTKIPLEQFSAPYRAVPDPSIRTNKHEHGCVYVTYCCVRTHRAVMGMVRALLSPDAIPG